MGWLIREHFQRLSLLTRRSMVAFERVLSEVAAYGEAPRSNAANLGRKQSLEVKQQHKKRKQGGGGEEGGDLDHEVWGEGPAAAAAPGGR